MGDEYGFFQSSVVAAHAVGTNIFSPMGHFSFPLLSNVVQGTIISLLGGDLSAFRLSGILPITLSIPAVIWAARNFVSPPVHLLAGLFLALDPLSAAIGSIGYNNSQMIPLWCWSFALSLHACRSGSPRAAAAAGVVAGLGYYTPYIAMMFVGTSLPLLLVLSWRRQSSQFILPSVARAQAAAFFLGFFAAAGPILLHADQLVRHVAHRGPKTWSMLKALGQVANAALAPLFFSAHSHTLTGRVVVPTVGTLTVLGFFMCLRRYGRPSTLFLASNAILLVVAASALAPYDYPAVTRLVIISGPVAILGALGAQGALDALASALNSRTILEREDESRLARGALVLAVGILCTCNLIVQQRGFCNEQQTKALGHVIRLALKLPSGKVFYFVRSDTSDLIERVLQYYAVREKVHVIRVPADGPKLLPPAIPAHSVAVIHHTTPRRQEVLESLGWEAGEASGTMAMTRITTGEGPLFAHPLSQSAAEALEAISSISCPNPFSAD